LDSKDFLVQEPFNMGLIVKEDSMDFRLVFYGIDPCESTEIIYETYVVLNPPEESNAGPQTSVCTSCNGAVETVVEL
jgi:hypothetical protein